MQYASLDKTFPYNGREAGKMKGKTHSFRQKNEQICIQNEQICIQNEQICIQNERAIVFLAAVKETTRRERATVFRRF